MTTKVKVGQVWTDGVNKYEITRIIDNREVYASRVGHAAENPWGSILPDGGPDGWDPCWRLYVVVKVGQVWTNGRGKLKITKVEPDKAYYVPVGNPNAQTGFGPLHPDGSPKDWSQEWTLETPAPPADPLLEFFKSVPPGHCPCNIPRAVCKYHHNC